MQFQFNPGAAAFVPPGEAPQDSSKPAKQYAAETCWRRSTEQLGPRTQHDEQFPALDAPIQREKPRPLPRRRSLLTAAIAALSTDDTEAGAPTAAGSPRVKNSPLAPDTPPSRNDAGTDAAIPNTTAQAHHSNAAQPPFLHPPGIARRSGSAVHDDDALVQHTAPSHTFVRGPRGPRDFVDSPVTSVRAGCPSERGDIDDDEDADGNGVHARGDAGNVKGPQDFQALREIGQGAFGKVYLVQSRITRRLYAMKVLNKQRVLAKEQVDYAMGERAVMTDLTHPYLVALRYAFQTNHRLFLVMDYVEGGHLWTHMKAGFLAEGVARIFAAEIVLALVHLHKLGIAHRDLKPENILLDSDNHCRLTDFGLAKRDLDEYSRAHTMVGTIDYMAPEIVRGDGHGRAVDWWSLGVLLYEMLCARLPFAPTPQRGGGAKGGGGRGGKAPRDPRTEPGTDEYKAEVKKKIQFSKVSWPRGAYTNPVSNAAKNLIQRLLARDPATRLQGRSVMEHEFFKSIDWDLLYARKVPSPLRSSIFAGAPDQLTHDGIDPAPLEQPCPKLAGYLFETDTPAGSPEAAMVSNFTGFSYVHQSELAAAAAQGKALRDAF